MLFVLYFVSRYIILINVKGFNFKKNLDYPLWKKITIEIYSIILKLHLFLSMYKIAANDESKFYSLNEFKQKANS
jgi:hypothetical protein